MTFSLAEMALVAALVFAIGCCLGGLLVIRYYGPTQGATEPESKVAGYVTPTDYYYPSGFSRPEVCLTCGATRIPTIPDDEVSVRTDNQNNPDSGGQE